MKIISLLLFLMFSVSAVALNQVQDSLIKYSPKGKVEGRIFSDFFYEFNQKKTAFEVTRVYLGYNYSYSENFSARVTLDVSKPEITISGTNSDTISTSLQHTAFLKYAYGVYKINRLTLSFGMIELNQFNLQDQVWAYRYVMKTIQDEYSFCPSADLGVKGDFKLSDWLSTDISFRNGEGYKKLQADNIYWYGIGFTLHPFKGFYYRTFFDYSKNVISQSTFSNFISYSGNKYRLGAEIVLSENFGFGEDKKLIGFSAFAAYRVSKKIEIFGRFDKLSSNTLAGATNAWNYNKNLGMGILGVQLNPLQNIAFALNGRYQIPENSSNDEKISVFMNLDFKF